MPLLKPNRSESEQYTTANVAAYELIYGRDFISPGGRELALHFATKLKLQPGERVLDIGSGLGGCACLMAEEFQAEVYGLDFSSSMVEEATKRARERGLSEEVVFSRRDCLEMEDTDLYHAVISRDVFLHIADKEKLFANIYRALKPGGRLLFTDYCCGAPPWPWSFKRYVKTRGYTLHTLSQYTALIENAGFFQVEAQDITQLFIDTLGTEVSRLKKLPWHKRTAYRLGWASKLKAARKGVHRWGLFQARKT